MWTKQQAKDYHKEWRAQNKEKWYQYTKDARALAKLMKVNFPVVYRKQHFAQLYGDVAPNVKASEVIWNIYCPISHIKLDYTFMSGVKLDSAILRRVNGRWQFVSLLSLPKGSRKCWRRVVKGEIGS